MWKTPTKLPNDSQQVRKELRLQTSTSRFRFFFHLGVEVFKQEKGTKVRVPQRFLIFLRYERSKKRLYVQATLEVAATF